MDLSTLERCISKVEMRKELLDEESSRLKQEFEEALSKIETKRKSSALLQHCSTHFRSTMSASIEETISWAIKLILNNDYSFKMSFEQKRNQWECVFNLIDPQGNETDMTNGTGGGVIDTVSLTLFVLFYHLFGYQNRLPVILDEPLKYLGTEAPEVAERTILFLKGLTEKLGLQIIMVTHQEPLVPAANKSYRFELREGKTVITDITQQKEIYQE